MCWIYVLSLAFGGSRAAIYPMLNRFIFVSFIAAIIKSIFRDLAFWMAVMMRSRSQSSSRNHQPKVLPKK